MIYIRTLCDCDMISQQLQRNREDNRRENIWAAGYVNYLTAFFTLVADALISKNVELAATRTDGGQVCL